MDDKLLQLAFSVYHNPGVYALLLGSGVSRSAGVFTGWEVMNDLIRKIAQGQQKEISGEPYLWYTEQYSEEPGYDSLIARLGITSFERKSLLQDYFEPTPKEREQDIKMPSRAHQSVAKLIKSENIRLVLTTNFDRLLEKALENEGITPDVISTVDALKGARPLQHSPITIIKLHGDYRDGRIKNTIQELAKYDARINKLLDRVLDEYGLIVCGWSAEWDEALRSALYRTSQGRYTTFWAHYGEIKDDAQRLIDHRHAEVIPITGADDFFYQLEQAVTALQSSNQRHPLSIPVTIERVKRLLPNPQTQIELEELLQEEAESAYQRITSNKFYTSVKAHFPGGLNTLDQLKQHTDLCYREIELVLHIVATITWYDEGKHTQTITRIVNRWLEIPRPYDNELYAYVPILLLIYSAGIGASGKGNWRYLQAILFDPIMSSSMFYTEGEPTFMDFMREKAFLPLVRELQSARGGYPNQVLQQGLRPVFERFLPSAQQYNNGFDLFEMLLSLAYLTITTDTRRSEWMPPHIACYFSRSWDYLKAFWHRGGREQGNWSLLQVEPFINQRNEKHIKQILTLYGTIAQSFQQGHRQDLGTIPDYAEIYRKVSSISSHA